MEDLIFELQEAKAAVVRAQNNFDNADLEYFDIANQELTSAKQHLQSVILKAKKRI